jgi:hypothetical protein
MNTEPSILPKQPPLWHSYLTCGRLLHASTLIFILESYLYYLPLERAIDNQNTLWISYWTGMFLFAFFHIFLVMADAWSRFQNYKRAKDQLYEYGFRARIVNYYIGSKCQRLAVETAAKELGYEDEVKKQFRLMGYRWYHYIPDFMIKDPWFLFKRYFWKRTFLEKYYVPKYNFHQLTEQSIAK